MRRISTCLALLALTATGAAASMAAEPAVEDLVWLTGSWCASSDRGTQEEHWIAPHGGILLGVHRDAGADGRVFYEFLRIQKQGRDIFYFAAPAGREPTPFRLVRATAGRVVFENPEHDFPQRIIYTRSEDRLQARIEGDVGGEIRAETWQWSAEDCGFLETR